MGVARLFPSKSITFEGLTVVIKPITISQLPIVSDILVKAKKLVDEGKSEQDIIGSMMSDILSIAESCIDKPLSEIPLAMTPDICTIIVKQNFSKDLLGKWSALKTEFEAAVGLQSGK